MVFQVFAHTPDAATQADIDVFASHNSAPDAMPAGFQYYLAFHMDAEQNRESVMNKIITPVLALDADIYPAVGGDFPGNFGLGSMQVLAANVMGFIVTLSGHWIPEE